MSLSNQHRSQPKKAVKESSQYSDLEEEVKLLEDALNRKKSFRKCIENELLEKVKTVNELKIKNNSLQEEVDDLLAQVDEYSQQAHLVFERVSDALDSSKVDRPSEQNKAMETETVDLSAELNKCMLNGKQRKKELLDKCMLNGKQRKKEVLRNKKKSNEFRKSLKDLLGRSFGKAKRCQCSRNYAEALKAVYFCIGLAEFPKQHARAWIFAGDLFRKLNRHNDAIKCYNNVLQHYSKSKQAYFSRAWTYCDLFDYENARNDLKTLLALNPNNIQAQMWLVHVESELANQR